MAQYSPWDLEVGTSITTRKGYMLAPKGKDDLPSWRLSTEVVALSLTPDEQVQTGVLPGEVIVNWDRWHLGMGHETPLRYSGGYAWAKGVYAGVLGKLVLGPLPTAMAYPGSSDAADQEYMSEANGTLWLASDRLYSFDTSAVTLRDSEAGVYRGPVIQYRDNLFVGHSGALLRYTASPPGSWANGPLSGLYFTKVGNRLYKIDTSGKMHFNTDDGLDVTDWQGNFDVGDPGRNISALLSTGLLLYAINEDGLVGFDIIGRSYNLMGKLVPQSYDGFGSKAESGLLYIPHRKGLLAYRSDGAQKEIIADHVNLREADIVAFVNAVWPTEGATIYAGAVIQPSYDWEHDGLHILVHPFGGDAWHSLYYLSGTGVTVKSILANITTTPAVVYFSGQLSNTGGDERVWWMYVPEDQDPTNITGFTFGTSGEIAFSLHDCGLPGVPKTYRSVTLFCEGLAATNRTVDVHYRHNIGNAWVSLGSATASGLTTLTFPDDKIGESIQLRLTLNRSDTPTTSTPIVRSVQLRAFARPGRRQVLVSRMDISDHVRDRDGHAEERPAADQVADLLTLFNAGSAHSATPTVVSLLGPDGEVLTCVPDTYQDEVTSIVREGEDFSSLIRVATCRWIVLNGDL